MAGQRKGGQGAVCRASPAHLLARMPHRLTVIRGLGLKFQGLATQKPIA